MKIQKINIVSESLKQLVAVLKDAEASTEAINLLGNLDPEFKRDADYLRAQGAGYLFYLRKNR